MAMISRRKFTSTGNWLSGRNLYRKPTPNLKDISGAGSLANAVTCKLGRHGVVVCGVNYQSEGLIRHFQRSGGHSLDIRLDPENLGHVSVWYGDAWHSVPAVIDGMEGVSVTAWEQAVFEIRQSNRNASRLRQDVVDHAFARIREIDADQRAYVPNDAYRKLDEYFRMLLEQRRADMADGSASKLRGIVLIGRSGSGKTTAIQHLIRSNRELLRTETTQEICELISLQVPSPATMKFVGTAVLQAAGYPLARDKSASTIWDMVRQQLRFRKTLFLHLDEAQDLTRFQTENERRSVVNTLKSLMENSRWPVGLILSGMPEFKTIINQDPQLARRLYPVEIDRLNEFRNVGGVIDLVRRYAGRAGIGAEEDLSGESFAQRLIHAADYEFGLMAELVVQSITMALSRDGLDARLSLSHFADVFHMRSAAVDGLNPFIAEDFRRIDPRQVLDHDSIYSADDPRGPR